MARGHVGDIAKVFYIFHTKDEIFIIKGCDNGIGITFRELQKINSGLCGSTGLPAIILIWIEEIG
jgi:hypothetical protein